ncbi:hypothetical protein HPB47_019195 [Ixodes persulcatus]|uniref:Uncharacterized protein n=1 Tax=Ixodes persulcatus TaxID=34615 RepID=A0AC60QIX1_IXOPE|nr:hypothetical protein HPB47_019195 [Ixodes persulcatus]
MPRAQLTKQAARAWPNGYRAPEAATEMVVLTEKLQRRRRHSRRRKAEQPVADKQDPSSSLVAEAPKPMDTEPPPKEAPVLVSSGENIGRQSYKAALQNKPPSSSPPVQAGPPYYACTGRLTFPAFFMRRHICRLRDLYGISWNDATEPEYEWLLAFPLDSPWSKHPFTIYEDIPGFHGKSRHPSVVSRALTEEAQLAVWASSVDVVRFTTVVAHGASIGRPPNVGLPRTTLLWAWSILRRRCLTSGSWLVVCCDGRFSLGGGGVGQDWPFGSHCDGDLWQEFPVYLLANSLGD